ncbi:hypothetical protein GF361_03435 [Candidatus Woesearchaeota archaeon]|nr:hypothetical protein [Candidatus Woesearchaeota archaeon]
MSGVEDIQKVNELAQELLKKNFVESRDEAVKKAQEMLNKNITGDVPEKEKETKEQGKSPDFHKKEEKEEKIGGAEEKQSTISENSLKELRDKINQTKKYTEKQFASYKNALIALEKEIRKVKQQVNKINMRKPNPEKKPMNVNKKENEKKEQDPAEEPQKVEEKENSNPRTGNHKSEDVSIEKMFYYGNK